MRVQETILHRPAKRVRPALSQAPTRTPHITVRKVPSRASALAGVRTVLTRLALPEHSIACVADLNQHHLVPAVANCDCVTGDGDLYRMEIVDQLRLPADLPTGDYVLGWRWDCEESTQVWSSCSDVAITAA